MGDSNQSSTENKPRISLQTLKVLSAMLTQPDSDYYGLELAELTGLKSGSLYPILIRLERHNWLESDWENIDPKAAGRRPRRYYRLTAHGVSCAKAEVRETAQILRKVPGIAL